MDVAGYGTTFADDWQTWFIRGLTLLVIACPCVFVISTPVSVVSDITRFAKNGVLIKGGNYLEGMGEVDVVAMDKTGTLTKGELAVTDVVPIADTDEASLLRYAAGLERHSEHPIAEAILNRADKANVDDLPDPTGFESLTGRGIRGKIDGETYYVGKPALFEGLGFNLSRSRETDGGVPATDAITADDETVTGDALTTLEREGKTVILVGTESELLGTIAIADEVRPASEWAVARLQELGIERVVMLTGDNEGTARAIAEQVDVDEYRAELLPDVKVAALYRAFVTKYEGEYLPSRRTMHM